MDAGIPCRRHPERRLSDRRGGALHGPPDRGAQRRPPSDPGVSFAPTRRGKGNHRTDPRRRNRSQSHQRRALPYGQVRTGLATKLIDGAENNWPSFVTTDHYKYAGYYTLTRHTMSPEVLIMSRKAWESLSAEDRTLFREAALQSSRFMRERWKDLEAQSRRQAESAGVTIVTEIDRKPFEAAMAPIYIKMQRDPAAARLIEQIRKVD